MYNNKLVSSIRVNGKILREFKDTVYLPYGVEYSILLKNLNTVRALVNVYIDGTNVVPGGLVLNAGQEIDLERSILNNNLTTGNKFKFIERTSTIEEHRGIKTEDGIIRVEYQFEKISPLRTTVYPTYVSSPATLTYPIVYPPYSTCSASNAVTGHRHEGVACSNSTMAVGSVTTGQLRAVPKNAAPQSENGITVPGSQSNQAFATASWFETEPTKHNIVLRLLGETEGNRSVREPVTVKSKPVCTTCGKTNKATAKFCSECGTSLQIFA